MRISRVFTEQALEPDQVVELDERTGHYLLRVLKLRPGDGLVLFNGDGFDYAAELTSAQRTAVSLRVKTRLPAVPESALHLTLVQAVGKGDRMDYSLQKATELGVAAIQPLFSERTEVRLQGARLDKRLAHWRAVTVAACEQSGRALVPPVRPPLSLAEWLAKPRPATCFVLDPRAERALAASPCPANEAAVLIGPEGGFSEQELKAMVLAGVLPVRLGPRVLRTESAGPAALAVLQALCGDFAPD